MPSTNATTTLLNQLGCALDAWALHKPWGVAFSGGRDSTVLLWGLVQMVGPDSLQALHVDHGWRSEAERLAERTVVEASCQRWGVALQRFAAPQVPVNSEASAREHRYRCFGSFLSDHPESPVFLAHHADDQAETILMRLLRGRSWQGLAGMRVRRGPFMRPLLGLSGTLLGQVAVEQNLAYHQDSSNLGDGPTRNFLRHQVFPLLKERFPGIVGALNGFGEAWQQMLPSMDPDRAWVFSGDGARIQQTAWDQWGSITKQAQLLAVATRIQKNARLSRRFLETLTRGEPRSERSGGGWQWSCGRGVVFWGRVVQEAPKEYFVKATAGAIYPLGAYSFSWSNRDWQGSDECRLFIPGVVPEEAFIWRSVVAGMSLVSVGEGVWNRTKKKKRLGSMAPDRCALVLQGGFLKAVVDPKKKTILWIESREEKLNKTGIFVKLLPRSDYER